MLFILFIAGMLCMGAALFPLLRSYRKQIGDLKIKAAESASGLSDFRDQAVKLAAAVKESASAITLIGRDSGNLGKNQTGSIEKIENTINENSKIAAEIVDKTGSVAAIASKMEEHVIQGFVILERNVKKMEDIKEKNSGAINGIISLSNKVGKIRDVVRVINTITDQTKVIAFNAALEAASSGETGKRFSVVAGEVNRLADNIDVLTRQIREQVEEVLSSSSSLIMYSEEGSDKIAEGYRLIKDLEEVFEEIKAAAEITSNQAQIITVSTQEQLKTSGQVNAGIAEISTLVKGLIGASESAAKTAGTLTERAIALEQFLSVKEAV